MSCMQLLDLFMQVSYRTGRSAQTAETQINTREVVEDNSRHERHISQADSRIIGAVQNAVVEDCNAETR